MLGNVYLSDTVNPGVFPFPNTATATRPAIDYKDRDKMFFGMGEFSLSRASRRLFQLITTNYGNLNTGYLANVGTYSVRVDFFWFAVRFCNESNGNSSSV